MDQKPNSQQKRELYLEAIRIQDHDERQRFLDERCAGESQLRSDLVKLLNANAPQVANPLGDAVTSETNLSTPEAMGIYRESFEVEESIDISNHPMIGRYKLLEQIGHGGMGTVYMAQQTEPVQRKVALKVIKPGMDTREVIARFEAERQALALMDHPNIARVLDGGSTDEGRPYFVMELVRGVPITQFCEQKNMSLRERLKLFVDVCKAVQHAHQKGIIHRDLKPSNIMVTPRDGVPVVKVIDFGVAKALSQQLTDKTLYTHYAQVVGTPLYMAPEQAEMSCLDIDTRSDIYSLGVVLYELLTGTTPFDRETLSSLGIDGIRQVLRDQEPPRPSVRVSTLRQAQQSTIEDQRKLDTKDISNQLKRELDWIVMKALEKDRERRYETANAFAADVQRYLNDEPVKACPPTVSYRLRKYIRKHKAWLTTAALLILMLITSTAVSGVFAYQANEARIKSEKSESDAKDAQNKAETEKEKALAAQKQSDENFASALAAIDKLLEHASNPALGEIPGAQAVRKEMMDDILKFHRQFAESIGDSPEIRHRASSTWAVIAQLAESLGERAESLEAYETSLKILTELVRQSPENKEYIYSLLNVRLAKGWCLFHSGEYLKSNQIASDVQSRVTTLIDEDAKQGEGNSSRLTQIKFTSARLRAISATRLENRAEHREQLQLAFDLSRDLPGSVPLESRRDLQHQLTTLVDRSDRKQLERHIDDLITLSRDAVAGNPARSNRSTLATHLYKSADFLAPYDTQRAQRYASESLLLLGELTEEFPGIPTYRYHLNKAVEVRLKLFDASTSIGDISAELLRYLNLSAEVVERVENAISHRDNTGDEFAKLLDENPNIASFFQHRGLFYRKRGEYETALVDLNRYVEVAPEDSFAYIYRAHVLTSLKQYEQAIENYGKALELDPRNDWSWADRAKIYMVLKNYEEAVSHFDRAIQLSPNPHFLGHRARAHFFLKQYANVLSDLNRILDIEPTSANVVLWIRVSDVGRCPDEQFKKGMMELAERAVELNEQSSIALTSRAALALSLGDLKRAEKDFAYIVDKLGAGYYSHYQAAILALKLNRQDRYSQLCQKMLTTFAQSESERELHFVAWTCVLAPNAVSDYEPAIKLARQSVEKEPRNRQYLDGLGAILLRAGQYDEAIQQLEKALKAGENDDTSSTYIYYFLAMTEHHLGNADAAKENLAKANASANKELSDSPAWNRKLTLELLRKESEALILSPNSDANN